MAEQQIDAGRAMHDMHEQSHNSTTKLPQRSRGLLANKHVLGIENQQPLQHATMQPQHALMGIKQQPATLNPFTSLHSHLSIAAHNAADPQGVLTMKGAQPLGSVAAPNRMFIQEGRATAPRRPLAPRHENRQQPGVSTAHGQEQTAKDMLQVVKTDQQQLSTTTLRDSFLGSTAASSKYHLHLAAAQQHSTAVAAACKDHMEDVQPNVSATPASFTQHLQDTLQSAGLLASDLLSSKPLTGHQVENRCDSQHPGRISTYPGFVHKLAAGDAPDQAQHTWQYLAGEQPPAGTSASSSTPASFAPGWLQHDHASFQPLTNHLSRRKNNLVVKQQTAVAPQASHQLAAGSSAIVHHPVHGCNLEVFEADSPSRQASSNLDSGSSSKGNSSYYSCSDTGSDSNSDDCDFEGGQQQLMQELWHASQLQPTQRNHPVAARALDVTACSSLSTTGTALASHTQGHVARTAAPAVAQQLAHAQLIHRVHPHQSTRVSHSILEGADSWPATQSSSSRIHRFDATVQRSMADGTSHRRSASRRAAGPAAAADGHGTLPGPMQTLHANMAASASAGRAFLRQQSSITAGRSLQEAADSHSSSSSTGSSTTGMRLMNLARQFPLMPLHLLSKGAQHVQGQHQGLVADQQIIQVNSTSAAAISIAPPGLQAGYETSEPLVHQLTNRTMHFMEGAVQPSTDRHHSTSAKAALAASGRMHSEQHPVGQSLHHLRLQGGRAMSEASAIHTIMRPPVAMPAPAATSMHSTQGSAEGVGNKLWHSYLEQYIRHQQWQAAQLRMSQGLHAAACAPPAPAGAACQQEGRTACQPDAGPTASTSAGIAARRVATSRSLAPAAIAGHHSKSPAAVGLAASAGQNYPIVAAVDEVQRTRQQMQLRLLQHSRQVASQSNHLRHGRAADHTHAGGRELAGAGSGSMNASKSSSINQHQMPLALGVPSGSPVQRPGSHHLAEPHLHIVNVTNAPIVAEAGTHLHGNTITHPISLSDQLTLSMQPEAALGNLDTVAVAAPDAAAATSPPFTADVPADAPGSAASAVTAGSICDTAQSHLRHELLDCSPFVGLAEYDLDYMSILTQGELHGMPYPYAKYYLDSNRQGPATEGSSARRKLEWEHARAKRGQARAARTRGTRLQ